MSEIGSHVGSNGQTVYDWPPEGRFRTLWDRIDSITTDVEKCELLGLLNLWVYENSTLVSYTDANGEWVDVEPDWNAMKGWFDVGEGLSDS